MSNVVVSTWSYVERAKEKAELTVTYLLGYLFEEKKKGVACTLRAFLDFTLLDSRAQEEKNPSLASNLRKISGQLHRSLIFLAANVRLCLPAKLEF